MVATHDPALSQIADQTVVMRDGYLEEAEGPLDFDLPDLIQHVEIVDPAAEGGMRIPPVPKLPSRKGRWERPLHANVAYSE